MHFPIARRAQVAGLLLLLLGLLPAALDGTHVHSDPEGMGALLADTRRSLPDGMEPDPNAVAQLFLLRQPAAGASGDTLVQRPAIQLRNSVGQWLRFDDSTRVHVEIISGDGGVLGGDLEEVASGGVVWFSLSLTGRIDQEYRLRFSTGDLSIDSAPVRVTHGPPHATRSSVDVGEGRAGTPTPITIRLLDAVGNPVSGAADRLAIALLAGPAPGTGFAPIVELGAGRYRTQYTPEVARTDHLSVTLDGVQIGAGPVQSVVHAGPAVPERSRITIPPGEAGMPTEIEVELQDAFGNGVSGRSAALSLRIMAGPNAGAVPLEIMESGAGGYRLGYRPLRSGLDQLELRLDGVSLAPAGIELSSTVHPGPAHRLELLSGPGAVAISGALLFPEPAVALRDAFGNPVRTAGIEIDLVLEGGGVLEGALPVETDTDGVANFGALRIAGTPGPRHLLFRAAGLEPVRTEPFQLHAGAPEPERSTLIGTPSMVGEEVAITLALRDATGNPLPSFAPRLEAVVQAGPHAGARVPFTALSSLADGEQPLPGRGDEAVGRDAEAAKEPEDGLAAGRYRAHYPATMAGTDRVEITLDGIAFGELSTLVPIAEALEIAVPMMPVLSVGAPGQELLLSARGGAPPFRWTSTPAAQPLPPGVALSEAGVLTLVPIRSGDQLIPLEVVDRHGFRAAASLHLSIAEAPSIPMGMELPAGERGIAYQTILLHAGGIAPHFWSVHQGQLPPGIHLDGARGILHGRPEAAGRYSFTLALQDGAGSIAFRDLTFEVRPGVEALLPFPLTPPGPPSSPGARAGDGTAELHWSPPAEDGGNAITGYQIEISSDAGDSWFPIATTSAAESVLRIEDLTNRHPYHFRVRAVNEIGTGPFSPPSPAFVPRIDAPELEISLAFDRSYVESGGTVLLLVTVVNQGGQPAEGVRIAPDESVMGASARRLGRASPGVAIPEAEPRRIHLLAAALTHGELAGESRSWEIGTLAPGEHASAELRLTISAGSESPLGQ